MKLTNIFKRSTKVVAKPNVEKLEKKQLEKVIGGADVNNNAPVAHEVAHVVQQASK